MGQVLRPLDRCHRPTPHQSLPHTKGGQEPPSQDGQPTHRKKTLGPGQTIAQIAALWSAQGRSQNHQTVAKEAAREFGHLAPAQITPLLVGALVASWKKRLAHNTVSNYTGKLQQFLGVLHNFGAPLIHTPKVAPERPRTTVATGDELARLFASPPAWMRLYLLFYFQCGMRRAETLRVTPRSWNREHHTAIIQVKGGGLRTALLTPEAEALMEGCGNQDPDTSFIDALHGRHITPAGLNKAWQRHRDLCGVNPHVHAHDLRRTAATIVHHATHDLRAAQQLLGHKNLTSTLSYLAPMAPEDARKYQELLRFDKFHTFFF